MNPPFGSRFDSNSYATCWRSETLPFWRGSGVRPGIGPESNDRGLLRSVSGCLDTSMFAHRRRLQADSLKVAARPTKTPSADPKRSPSWPNTAPVHGRRRSAPKTPLEDIAPNRRKMADMNPRLKVSIDNLAACVRTKMRPKFLRSFLDLRSAFPRDCWTVESKLLSRRTPRTSSFKNDARIQPNLRSGPEFRCPADSFSSSPSIELMSFNIQTSNA